VGGQRVIKSGHTVVAASHAYDLYDLCAYGTR